MNEPTAALSTPDLSGETLSRRIPPIDTWFLRQLLTLLIHGVGRPVSVAELVQLVNGAGYAIEGRPGKRVSDTLRGPVGRGWVVRLDVGVYGPGYLPKVTKSRMRQRLAQMPHATQQ